MPDSFTHTSSRSWFSRLKGAFAGVLFGTLLFFGSFALLFWNEGRAVQTYKTLVEGAGMVISLTPTQLEAANEGKLVHVSGLADTGDVLNDPLFNVQAKALRLSRRAEMLQWVENKKSETRNKIGGGTETVTTYSYSKEWRITPVDSSKFRHPQGHENPPSWPVSSKSWQAGKVTLGSFMLGPDQVRKINVYKTIGFDWDNLPNDDLSGRSTLEDGVIYIGSRYHKQIGDMRIKMSAVYPTNISLIAKQSGSGFVPYKAAAGGTIDMLETGMVPADQMFEAAQTQNTILTWGLRFAGLMLMFFGLKLTLRVIRVLADIVPLFGSIVGAGTSIIAFLVAFCLSLVTISIAWLYYRPLVGGTLLLIAALVALYTSRKVKTASREVAIKT